MRMSDLTTYVGQKKALVFPVMCDGYLQIDYSDEIAGQDYGIFGHNDSITIEAIVTPYDINGLGYKFADKDNPAGPNGVVNSVKTMPAVQRGGVSATPTLTNQQSHLYRDEANRITDKMIIFHNDAFELFLQNDTVTNQNQPAEYKIGLKVRVGSTTDTLLSAAVFSSQILQASSSATAIYSNLEDTITLASAEADVNTHSTGTDNFEMDGANDSDNYFYAGQNLYYLTGGVYTSIGRVVTVESSGKTVTMSAAITPSIAGESLYTDAQREAPYLLSSNHIAVSYNNSNGKLDIYFNGESVASSTHSSSSLLSI